MWKRANRHAQAFAALLIAALASGPSLLAQEPPADAPETEPAEPQRAKPAPPMPPEVRAKLIAELRAAYAKPRAEWPKPQVDEGRPFQELGTPEPPPSFAPLPNEDPAAATARRDKALLGLSLFSDSRLSGSQGVACISCHEPQLGWSNGVAFSFGEQRQRIRRHPPTLIGIGQRPVMFWDGRATTLEQQAHDVIVNKEEMAGDPAEIIRRLEAEKEFYPPRFEKAFGDPAITFDRVLTALAAYERTIRAGRTKFDAFIAGKGEFTDAEIHGLHLFRTKARCMNCHSGSMFTDNQFHNLGLTYYGRTFEDLGRYNVTKKPENVGEFLTPTLRNIGRTSPYMHNGVFPSLDGVLRLYNAGMARPKPKETQKDDPLFPKTSDILKPLALTPEELGDLKAFLLSLDEPMVRVTVPPVPPLPSAAPVAPAPVPSVTPAPLTGAR